MDPNLLKQYYIEDQVCKARISRAIMGVLLRLGFEEGDDGYIGGRYYILRRSTGKTCIRVFTGIPLSNSLAAQRPKIQLELAYNRWAGEYVTIHPIIEIDFDGKQMYDIVLKMVESISNLDGVVTNAPKCPNCGALAYVPRNGGAQHCVRDCDTVFNPKDIVSCELFKHALLDLVLGYPGAGEEYRSPGHSSRRLFIPIENKNGKWTLHVTLPIRPVKKEFIPLQDSDVDPLMCTAEYVDIRNVGSPIPGKMVQIWTQNKKIYEIMFSLKMTIERFIQYGAVEITQHRI